MGYWRRMFFPVLLAVLVHGFFVWQFLTMGALDPPGGRLPLNVTAGQLFWAALLNQPIGGFAIGWEFGFLLRILLLLLVVLAASWLMLGWLAHSLGWEVREAEGDELRFARAEGGEVIATISAGKGDHRLRGLTLAGEGFSFAFTWALSGRGNCRIEHGKATRRESFHMEEEADLITLSREIDAMHHGGAYAATLDVIRRALKG